MDSSVKCIREFKLPLLPVESFFRNNCRSFTIEEENEKKNFYFFIKCVVQENNCITPAITTDQESNYNNSKKYNNFLNALIESNDYDTYIIEKQYSYNFHDYRVIFSYNIFELNDKGTDKTLLTFEGVPMGCKFIEFKNNIQCILYLNFKNAFDTLNDFGDFTD